VGLQFVALYRPVLYLRMHVVHRHRTITAVLLNLLQVVILKL